jgi:hypothetical protein
VSVDSALAVRQVPTLSLPKPSPANESPIHHFEMDTIFQKDPAFGSPATRKCRKSHVIRPAARCNISEYWNKKSSSRKTPKCTPLAPREGNHLAERDDYTPPLPSSHSIFKPAPQPVTIERIADLRRVSEWLAATLEMEKKPSARVPKTFLVGNCSVGSFEKLPLSADGCGL